MEIVILPSGAVYKIAGLYFATIRQSENGNGHIFACFCCNQDGCSGYPSPSNTPAIIGIG